MSEWLRSTGTGPDGFGRDDDLTRALQTLDPASQDPNYWFRFRGWVMSSAARELAQRRLMAQLTIGDVMSSWARALVPSAVLAAAVAGLLLLRADTAHVPQSMGVEELLVTELPGETVPVLLAPDGSAGLVAFASEIF